MKRKTFTVPDEPNPPDVGRIPFFSFGGADLRDTSKPVIFDENGNPLYAPRGLVMSWPA